MLLTLATPLLAGPVEIYREGSRWCPRDRPTGAPVLSEQQVIERAATLLPREFCAPGTFVSGCDFEPEFALDSWRVYVHQYRERGARKDRGGLAHTYVILDRAGNCLANIPGTDFGAPN